MMRHLRKEEYKEKQKLEDIILAHYEEIYKYCYRHLGRKEPAEDITQEVFLKFMVHSGKYREKGKMRNYLYVIARNAIRDFIRKKTLEDGYSVPEQGQRDETGQLIERIHVADCLARLSHADRELIILRYYQELKFKDIAAILKMPVSTVRYQMKQAEQRLKERLEER